MQKPRGATDDRPGATLLSARTIREPGATIVKLHGEIDIQTEDDFARTLRRALEDRGRRRHAVILDLTGVQFLAACGVRRLAEARAAADRIDVDLRLAAGRVAVRSLRLTGAGDAFALYPSVAEARRGT